MKSPERLDLLAQVASWYYEQKLEQSEIAKRIGKSVSMVSRLLAEAHREGLIEIRVHFAIRTDEMLENALCRQFGLKSAAVLQLDSVNDENRLRKLGELGARVVKEYLKDGVTIGVGWGRSVHQVIAHLPQMHLTDARVVQVMGGIGSTDPLVAGPELSRWFAEKIGATFYTVQAPMLVENESMAKALLRNRDIKHTLDIARSAQVILLGIGGADAMQTVSVSANLLTRKDIDSLARAEAVGDLMTRYVDLQGRQLKHPINQRVVGLEIEALRKVPNVIGVASGLGKAQAILAALRGKHINSLVTDSVTATEVLQMDRVKS